MAPKRKVAAEKAVEAESEPVQKRTRPTRNLKNRDYAEEDVKEVKEAPKKAATKKAKPKKGNLNGEAAPVDPKPSTSKATNKASNKTEKAKSEKVAKNSPPVVDSNSEEEFEEKPQKPQKAKVGRKKENKDTKDKNGAAVAEEKPSRAKRGKPTVKEDPESEEETPKEEPEKPQPPNPKPLRTYQRAKPAAAAVVKKDDEVTEEKTEKVPSNKTSTNWEEVNLGTDRLNKRGEKYSFQITSWNVSGIRAWIKKGGMDIFKHCDANIFCLQETKCSQDKLPEEVKNMEGYKSYWACSKKEGYAGVGILTKTMPIDVVYGIGAEDHDQDGRCITAEFKNFYLVNVYVTNSGRGLVTLDKRLDWNKKFKDFVNKLNEKKPVIICGDMNVAHKEIDLKNPKTNVKNAGFTPQEREGMSDFLSEGYVDSYRELYPDKEDAYTFWSFMGNSRSKNVGWRLDYFIVSNNFIDKVCDNVIHSQVFGSDHCPLSLYFQC